MICKACGAINEEGIKYCRVCASPLDEPNPEPSESIQYVDPPASDSKPEPETGWGFVRAPRWPKPEFNARTITEEDLEEFQTSPEPEETTGQAYTGYSPKHFTPPEPVAEPESSSVVGSVGDFDDGGYSAPIRPMAGGASMNDDAFGSPAYHSRTAPSPYRTRQQRESEMDSDFFDRSRRSSRHSKGKARHGGGNAKNILFWAAAGVLVVAIIVLLLALFTRSSGGISAFFGNIFSSGPITRDPVVEKSATKDGDPAYAFTIYAKNGSTVRFTAGETVNEYAVTDGKIALRIQEAMWLPAEAAESSPIEVVPDFTIIAEDGTETKLELEPISIELPSVSVALTTPDTANVVTSSNKVAFAGTVSDPDAAIFVNDQQYEVELDGTFSGTYELAEPGTQALTVEARKPGAVIGRTVINVEYNQEAPAAIAIGLAEGATMRTTEASFTVKGTMEAGASIAVTGAVQEGSVTFDSAAGTFSFTAVTPEVGQYTATVTATKDGVTASKDFHLEHAPDLDSYSRNAFKMDYAAITATPNQAQQYKCVGTIEEMIEEGEKVLAKMDVGGGNMVVIEYHPNYPTAASIAVGDGKTYSIYAYPNGTYTDGGATLPLMYAWFVLKG